MYENCTSGIFGEKSQEKLALFANTFAEKSINETLTVFIKFMKMTKTDQSVTDLVKAFWVFKTTIEMGVSEKEILRLGNVFAGGEDERGKENAA